MNSSVNLNPYPAYNSYIPQVNPDRTGNLRSGDEGKYIVTTKILVLALAVLFAVVFFVVCLHIYAKWIWSTNPARGSISFSFWRRRRRRRASPGDEVVLDADALDITTVMGLGKLAVDALPKFTYKMADHPKSADQLECAICLGKFEEDEMGRALPKCGHSFHLECIDMWLYSHSTCPLCRAVLELPDEDDDSSASLTFETPTIHLEPMTAPRRLGRATEPDQTILARRPPEPLTESEQASQPAAQDQESANKRADSIPANILFWGNNRQQATADSRLSPVVNNNSPRAAPSQVVIDIETDTDVLERDLHHDTIPHAAHSSSPVASVPRGAATLHRLFGRGRLPASSTEDGDEMRVRPFRPSPSPSPSATATATAAPA